MTNRRESTYEAPAMERVPLEPATFAGFYRVTWPLPDGSHPSGQVVIDRR